LLLVDSEDPVREWNSACPPTLAWDQLRSRDGWKRPAGVEDDQAQLMVACMETWILADQGALGHFYGKSLQANSLPQTDLEALSRQEVQEALEKATRNCGRPYCKGPASFKVLGMLDPALLKSRLSYFRRIDEALHRLLG
jgi:hypothetical protein